MTVDALTVRKKPEEMSVEERIRAGLPAPGTIDSDEPEMESSRHYDQLRLLVECLEWLWQDRTDYFIGANLSIYYDRSLRGYRAYSGPDFFLVKGIEGHPRRSWVTWNEGGKFPELIIELLSDSTARIDRGKKKKLYAEVFGTPEYILFGPESGEFEGYRLRPEGYESITPDSRGWLRSERLGLWLGVVEGQLRYFTPDGAMVPRPKEAALQETIRADRERYRAELERRQAERERQRAEEERRRAERAHQQATQERERAERERLRAERLAARLKEMGIDPGAE